MITTKDRAGFILVIIGFLVLVWGVYIGSAWSDGVALAKEKYGGETVVYEMTLRPHMDNGAWALIFIGHLIIAIGLVLIGLPKVALVK